MMPIGYNTRYSSLSSACWCLPIGKRRLVIAQKLRSGLLLWILKSTSRDDAVIQGIAGQCNLQSCAHTFYFKYIYCKIDFSWKLAKQTLKRILNYIHVRAPFALVLWRSCDVTGVQVRGTSPSAKCTLVVIFAIWQGQCHTLEKVTFFFIWILSKRRDLYLTKSSC